ncbi:exodeoxyribonuclease VII large subunit [Tumidithrix elongata RA019]|uniref:Exodeoxyribonuclease 7 large subunit n=1 Tax=Tumidithrix elongata BACA0141 TaxID=2716417 RepID=A0AAW9PVE7_9CYAN|nr:exodeoxyribonuclease VII large subunit [Tumidithrix elongata RA019]
MSKTIDGAVSVSAITQAIAQLLKEGIGEVRVTGEISGFKTAYSGHRYFALKDDAALIDCVMWSSKPLAFIPTDGMRVVVGGKLTIYPTRGKYQIDCDSMVAAGQGDLYLAFEALKRNLQARGFFNPEIKQPLPLLPLNIGVVTSPTGAAIQDILSTLKRRSPHCHVYVCAATVQGDTAPVEVAAAIRRLNQLDLDVIIVGRGGGSLEDLWAFNSLEVAEAIYASAIPIVSAVGHETDFTIADFVADVRAATPTGAAELVTQCDRAELLQQIAGYQQQLTANVNASLQQYRQKIHILTNSYGFQNITSQIKTYQQQIDETESLMQKAMTRNLRQAKTQLEAIAAHLHSLHPLAPLQRGFALLRHQDRAIAAHESLTNCDRIEIVRHTEIAHAKIERVIPKENSD